MLRPPRARTRLAAGSVRRARAPSCTGPAACRRGISRHRAPRANPSRVKCAVAQLQGLAHQGEDHEMLARAVGDPQGVDADLSRLPDTGPAGLARDEPAGGDTPPGHFTQPQRGPARRVFLGAMMPLDDLDIRRRSPAPARPPPPASSRGSRPGSCSVRSGSGFRPPPPPARFVVPPRNPSCRRPMARYAPGTTPRSPGAAWAPRNRR